MQSEQVVCKPTSWFKSRVIGMGILLLGFGLYFFYDARIGYPQKNEVYFTHQAFERAGNEVDNESRASWEAKAQTAVIDFHGYPVPEGIDPRQTPWPDELKDYDLMKAGWHDAWMQYTSRLQLPIKPEASPLNDGKINEQWIAGGISCALFLVCVALFIRTIGRVMAINGNKVTAAGTEFSVSDITLLDLRKWKNKGIAYATTGGKKVRLDGFCYGGFDKKDSDTNAEAFMKKLMETYKGDIIDFAETSSPEPGQKDDSPLKE